MHMHNTQQMINATERDVPCFLCRCWASAIFC